MADEYLIVVLHYHLSLGCRTNVLHSNQTQIHQREATYVVQIRRIVGTITNRYNMVSRTLLLYHRRQCDVTVWMSLFCQLSQWHAMSSIIDIDIVAGEHPDPRLNLALDLVVRNMFYTSLWPCPWSLDVVDVSNRYDVAFVMSRTRNSSGQFSIRLYCTRSKQNKTLQP